MKAKRLIEKTGGNGNAIIIPDPLYHDIEGNFKKYRRGLGSNLIPKKKKRK